MTKLIILFLVATGCFNSLIGDTGYRYFIDLTAVSTDKLHVKLIPPQTTDNEVIFHFPAMVPGTYDVYDFGRFVSNLKATGKNKTSITIEKVDVNTYKLSPANVIDTISYDVEDTWDTEIKENIVFEPGGTNIERGKNFIINTHGFFGYIKNQTNREFTIEVTKPVGFYASSGLTSITSTSTKDNITISNYHDLVDSPIMYCIPDTTIINVANTKVLVSVYSPNKKITSKYIAKNIEELLYAQRDYLGGQLPVDKYAFLLYFTDEVTLSGASGALEHSYSSFYVLPEVDSAYVSGMVREVAAHEFFHIVTPLNIHSEEIGNFDFNTPRMSKHLWLYEGLTEYAAHHVQVKQKLISLEDFTSNIEEKIRNSKENFNDTLPFTTMSLLALNKYNKEYNNVYEKGALIGMCLDILLRHQSNGKYGTQELLKDLSKKYGKHQSFKDNELFNDIEKLTYPEIRQFLDKHVAGNTPLPYNTIFNLVGLNYADERKVKQIIYGPFPIGYNPDNDQIYITEDQSLKGILKKLKFKEGDVLTSLNNQRLNIDNVQAIVTDVIPTLQKGDILEFGILRKDKKGENKPMILKTKIKPVKVVLKHVISVNEKPNEKQLQIRNAWLGIK